MADTQSKELKVREKQEVASPAEQTTPGLVFTPAVDIFETEKEITLLADMPGVNADNLTIDLRDNTLTLSAEAPAVVDRIMPKSHTKNTIRFTLRPLTVDLLAV